MNVVNINKAIAILERAKNLDMSAWQQRCHVSDVGFAETEAQLHQCGNAACFGGYIAISPEFRADGGYSSEHGIPMMREPSGSMCCAEYAISLWLGLPYHLTHGLVYGYHYGDEQTGVVEDDDFYDKPFKLVVADDVIEKLQAILNGELK